MAKYNSVNDVLAGHINALIEKNNLNKSDYPFQNDMYSAMTQLAKVYSTIGGKTVKAANDSFSIVGALDSLLDVVDSIISPGTAPTYLIVTNGSWNIRSEPNATSEIVGKVKARDRLISRNERSGGWIGIEYEGLPAWISNKAFV